MCSSPYVYLFILNTEGWEPLVKAVCTEIASMEGAPNGPALLPLASVGSQGIRPGPRTSGQAGLSFPDAPEVLGQPGSGHS